MAEEKYKVIVIGAGLTGLTTAYYLHKAGVKIRLLEQNQCTGGQIHTHQSKGFVFESGPNTGVLSHPEVADLFTHLSEDCQYITANPAAKKRLIWKDNAFYALPSSLLSAITTPLFSWGDKFRILGEPWRAKGDNPDESVGALAKRRLGKTFLEYAVDPFVGGIYAGDPMKLVTRFALPKLYRLEQDFGSFIRGTIHKARQPKTERERTATKEVFSCKGGLSALTEALTQAITYENISLGITSLEVLPDNNIARWKVCYQNDRQESVCCYADHVVSTVGAYALPPIFPFITEGEMRILTHIDYAPVVQVAVGMPAKNDDLFNAFGGLVPSKSQLPILGILFPSACFDNRTPHKDIALYSIFMGGMRNPNIIQKTNEEIRVLVMEALHKMLGYEKDIQPSMLQIFRHQKAIPQYDIYTGSRYAMIEKLQKQYPGLWLAGNMRDGIGMADRIKQGTNLAVTILS